jgi:riboflavin synthase
MFTGIVESTGTIKKIKNEVKVDQSVSHNGVCLTVVSIKGKIYDVVAIDETLTRSNLSLLKEGNVVNLERCTKVGDRLDGHIVQGHVDTVAKVMKISQQEGSWIFYFQYEDEKYITVEKGSICVNGISLTVVDSVKNNFSVAIIPYTFEHTNFKDLKVDDVVNIEFDIIGKYVERLMKK